MPGRKECPMLITKDALPVNPGDTVYILDEGKIREKKVMKVGITDEYHLFVKTGGYEYFFGVDSVFFTRTDALRYMDDPGSIPEDYGYFDYRTADIPYKPGSVFYYCEKAGMGYRDNEWLIFRDVYTYITFSRSGAISVGNDEGESTVGGGDYPCFETLKEAQHYIRERGGRVAEIIERVPV